MTAQPERPPDGWQDDAALHDFGWAPGGYLVKCIDCPRRERGAPIPTPVESGDKRAWRCRPHAVEAWRKAQAAPPPAAPPADLLAEVRAVLRDCIGIMRLTCGRFDGVRFPHRELDVVIDAAAALLAKLRAGREAVGEFTINVRPPLEMPPEEPDSDAVERATGLEAIPADHADLEALMRVQSVASEADMEACERIVQQRIAHALSAAPDGDAVERALAEFERGIGRYCRGRCEPRTIEAARQAGMRAALSAARQGIDEATVERCALVAHNAGLYSQRYVDDEPPDDVRTHNYACWKIRDAIRALLSEPRP